MKMLIKLLLFFVLIVSSITKVQAFKRYFRGDVTATNNNWSNANCWVRTSGGTYSSDYTYFATIHPGGTNNDNDTVIFDATSFPSATAYYVNLDQTRNICHTVLFQAGVRTGGDIIGTGILEVHGNFIAQTNVGSALGYSTYFANFTRTFSFTGALEFRPDPTTYPATTYQIQTSHVGFECAIKFLTESNYTITGDLHTTWDASGSNYYVMGGAAITVDIGNGTLQNGANDTTSVGRLYISSGNVILNDVVLSSINWWIDGGIVLNKSSSAYPSAPCTLTLNDQCIIYGKLLSIGANCSVTMNMGASVNNKLYMIDNVGTLNLKNSIIDFEWWPYGTFIGNSGIINHGTSIINVSFSGTTSSVSLGGDTLNEVNIYGPSSILNYGTAYIKTLTLYDKARLELYSGSPIHILASGTLELKAGSVVDGVTYSNAINLLASSNFIANGTCTKPVTINHCTLNLHATTTTSFSNLLINTVTITGTTPYAAGANSNILGYSPGWTPSLAASQNYYWQGAIPSSTTDTSTYALWHTVANWSNNPAASPTSPQAAATCLPSVVDSVIFPNQSYVNIRQIEANCKSMTWINTGVLAGASDSLPGQSIQGVKRLNIYGSLTFSTAMQNLFMGDVYFKAWQAYPTITSNGKSFRRCILFKGTASNTGAQNGTWALQDSLTATKLIGHGTGIYTVYLQSGHLKTNNHTMRFANWLLQLSDGLIDSTELTLGSSKVYISEQQGSYWGPLPMMVYTIPGKLQINEGTSHIIFKSNAIINGGVASNRLYIAYTGHKFYDVSFMDNDPSILFKYQNYGRTVFHNVDFYQTGIYWSYTDAQADTIHRMRTNVNYASSSAFSLGSNSAGLTNCRIVIDTAIYNGSADLNIATSHRYMQQLSAGKVYTIASTPVDAVQSFHLATSYLSAVGTCASPIIISGGRYSSTVNTQSAHYLLLSDNTASTSNFTYYNSTVSNATGWILGSAPIARKLHWLDGTAGASGGNWNDVNRWQKWTGAAWSAIGECPPTPVDTVIFDNSSFSGTDTVIINLGSGVANCHTMKWLTTSGTPVLRGVATENLKLYGSLYFSNYMTNNFIGTVTFRGSTATNYIQSSTKVFNGYVYFDADAPRTVNWVLQDSITATAVMISGGYYVNTVKLKGGTLNTNNQKAKFATFNSEGSKYRKLILGSSIIEMTSNCAEPYTGPYYYSAHSFLVAGDSMFVNAGTSTIKLTTGFTFFGGGHKWNKINLSGTPYYNQYAIYSSTTNTDTIKEVNGNSASMLIGLWSGRLKIGKVNAPYSTSAATYIYGKNTIDSLLSYRNTIIEDSNTFSNIFDFQDGRTYTFPANKVNYFKNACAVNAIGSASSNIYLYSSATGQKAYLRKDSGVICTNYSQLQDIYAIGNGGSYSSPSSSYATILTDTILNSSVYDGVTQIASGAGVGTVNPPQSGRAKFTAGEYAVNLNTSSKGWDFSSYSTFPTVTLSTDKSFICFNDSVQVTVSLSAYSASQFPLSVYGVIDGNPFVLTFPNTSTTTRSFKYYMSNHSVTVSLTPIVINRCFNNTQGLTNTQTIPHNSPLCYLPIELLSFEAEKIDNTKALLTWATATETNNDYFTIERSSDGNEVEELGKIKGAGNSTSVLTYQLIDEHPTSGVNYYRVKQTDFDGTSTYSNWKKVFFSNLETTTVNIAPNPIQNTNFALVELKGFGKMENIAVRLTNNLGQQLDIFTTLTDVKGEAAFPLLYLLNKPSGMYYLEVKSTRGVYLKKIVVE